MNETYRLRNSFYHASAAMSEALADALGHGVSFPVSTALQRISDLAALFDERLAAVEHKLGKYQEVPLLALNWPSGQRIMRLSYFVIELRRCSHRWHDADPASITTFVLEHLKEGPKVAGGDLIGLHKAPADAAGEEPKFYVVRTPLNGG